MITVKVVDQNANRVVLEGVIEEHPQLSERWTVAVTLIGINPSILAQARDELIARLEVKRVNWLAAQEAIASL